ncbi:HAD family hydrolase [Reinekea forsetii]|uniref:phosphoglycolate phosphatase n=1 Tax=Reinekea forsetii TaxID=1336806 RepID=A0A2K8KLX0_9GAMM|nr:HAD family hydrolase [Reinekea forsetii]ATX75860.1 haloacid dehalogenase [Reinekea forsetii]
MFKAIVFDMDMTLCYPRKEFDNIFKNIFNKTVESVMPGWLEKITIDGPCSGQEAVDYCFSDYSLSERQLLFQSLTQQWADAQELFHGVPDLPRKLKDRYGCKVGIMTNGPSVTQHAILDHLKLIENFDFCYASGDDNIAMRKPNDGLITLLQERENIVPSEALFVGDSVLKDLAPAIRCGWSGLHVDPTNAQDCYVTFKSLEKATRSGECLTLNWANLA